MDEPHDDNDEEDVQSSPFDSASHLSKGQRMPLDKYPDNQVTCGETLMQPEEVFSNSEQPLHDDTRNNSRGAIEGHFVLAG